MTEFTGKAFPTTYRGRRYRSRLEARWAAFFDQLGWKHEYEPIDLGSWSPDFLLPDIRTFVEIKPISEFDEAVADKMLNACQQSGALSGDPPAAHWLLLCGVAPIALGASTRIGWKAEPGDGDGWRPALIEWTFGLAEPVFRPELVDRQVGGWICASGNAGGHRGAQDRPIPFQTHTMEKWATASNLVQWNAR